MSEKCIKTKSGRNILLCENLVISINAGLFEQSEFSGKLKNTGEKVHRIGISTRKYKNKYALLSYCPFCSVHIDTRDYGLSKSNNGGENA